MSEGETRPCTRCARIVSVYVAVCPFCDSLLPARPRPPQPVASRPSAPSAAPTPAPSAAPAPGPSVLPAAAPPAPPAPATAALQAPADAPRAPAPSAPAHGDRPTPVHPAPAQASSSQLPPVPSSAPVAPVLTPLASLPPAPPAEPTEMSPALHAALFVMALPALVPGLVLSFLLALAPREAPALRWTKRPFFVPALTAVLVTLAAIRYPLLLVIEVSALGSMTYLYLRHDARESEAGALPLGYSIVTIGLVVLGGALSYVGAFSALAVVEADAILTPAEMADRDEDRVVARVRDVTLDATRVYSDGSHFTLSQVYAGPSKAWVRVPQTESRVWVILPEPKWQPAEVVHVEVTRQSPETSSAVLTLVPDVAPGKAPARIVTLRPLSSEEASAARKKVLADRDFPVGALALAPGLALLAVATWRAARDKARVAPLASRV